MLRSSLFSFGYLHFLGLHGKHTSRERSQQLYLRKNYVNVSYLIHQEKC